MGSIFSKGLTKAGVQAPGQDAQYFDSPEEAAAAASKQLPSADAMLGPDALNPNTTAPALPKIYRPSFAEAQDNPSALSKGGKLVSLLMDGLVGAAAGDAAARTGDPRNGFPGPGAAFMAGLSAPLQLRGSRRQLERQRIADEQERQLRDAQIAAIPDQRKAAQASLANVNAATRLHNAQADLALNKPDADPNTSIDLMIAHSAAQALKEGRDPSTDPIVLKLQDVKASSQKDSKATGIDNTNRFLAIESKRQQGLPLTPEEKAFHAAYSKDKTMAGVASANIRVEGFNQSRQYPVIDTANNNALVFANPDEINANPGRYVPAGEGGKALTRTALIEDIRGNVQAVRQSLQNMPEFSPTMRAQVAVALKSRDPKSAIGSLVGSEAAKTMTPEQQDYLINTALLVENAMAMRSVLGAGQGSEDLRSAITATIPGPTTPTKGYGLKQLDAFEQVLDRLEKGVPGVPLGGKAKLSLRGKSSAAGSNANVTHVWTPNGLVSTGGQ